jgi:hypothetical protein
MEVRRPAKPGEASGKIRIRLVAAWVGGSSAPVEDFFLTGGNRVFESEEMKSPSVLSSHCFLLFNSFQFLAPEPGAARVWNQKQLMFPLPNIDAIASIFGNELLGRTLLPWGGNPRQMWHPAVFSW